MPPPSFSWEASSRELTMTMTTIPLSRREPPVEEGPEGSRRLDGGPGEAKLPPAS